MQSHDVITLVAHIKALQCKIYQQNLRSATCVFDSRYEIAFLCKKNKAQDPLLCKSVAFRKLCRMTRERQKEAEEKSKGRRKRGRGIGRRSRREKEKRREKQRREDRRRQDEGRKQKFRWFKSNREEKITATARPT